MKVTMDTHDVLQKHAELIANNKAKIIDGYCQLYIKKCPWWLPKKVYTFILRKVLVLAFFRDA